MNRRKWFAEAAVFAVGIVAAPFADAKPRRPKPKPRPKRIGNADTCSGGYLVPPEFAPELERLIKESKCSE